jgi:DNA repair protein RecN (Recombination protein N)
MLADLVIKNIAIIDSLHVSFRRGLNVLTGETGAGKSIIIDAVTLIMGARASADMIRTGEEEASVECLFEVPEGNEVRERLAEAGVTVEGELLVKRTISRSGKNRVFMNGGLATTSQLAETIPILVNIYGQHESQFLLKTDNHLRFLDGFGGLERLRERHAALYGEYCGLREEIRSFVEGEREVARRIDLLSFQSREIGEADLTPGEDEALAAERLLLMHGERLLRTARGSYEVLYEGDDALLGRLRRILTDLEEAAGIDEELKPLATRLEEAFLQLEDSAISLRDYAARTETDPERIIEVDERLELIRRLKKKYAPTIEGIISFKEEADRELATLQNREEGRHTAEERLRGIEASLGETGSRLSRERLEAAGNLRTAMERELSGLAMKNARFDTAFSRLDQPRASGMERIEFLFSPNPGEELKPLARIASGGELSRLMLALKQIHPESDVATLIFDEVDSGIGGAVSSMVGRKLKRVAQGRQVLCITHMPQVAAFADHHFKVEKTTESGRTVTGVRHLSAPDRVSEIARMLGGTKITEKTLEHAREMLDDCSGV